MAEALPGKERDLEDTTVTDTGNETMIENMICYDWNVDVEEKERGTRTDIVSTWEIKRNMVVIGSERGNTGIIADGEVTQGTKVGVGIARIVRVGSIGRDMHTAALVPEDRDGAEDNGT
uniref:Uncharacterized protein n=1 Tax=Quercus lobata TaxID=97700 RepID=A0A7N2L4P1_QUELO